MIGNFFESFGKEKDKMRELPKDVLRIANENLPDNYVYIRGEDGNYHAVPKAGDIEVILTTTIDLKENDNLATRLRLIPKDRWDEYFYRIQQSIPVKSAKVGDEKKMIPLQSLTQDPLQDEEEHIIDAKISPKSFPNSPKVKFESVEGDIAYVTFKQQAYDNLTEILFKNTDFPALNMQMYFYSPLAEIEEESHTSKENPVAVTYSVNATKAKNVKDAVAALHIFRGLLKGTVKINDCTVSFNEENITESQKIEDLIDLWETALKLEEILEVDFKPDADFPLEDRKLFAELKTCLIEKEPIIWKHPFDSFTVHDFSFIEDDVDIESYIEKPLLCKFEEGPFLKTLLGAEFTLFSKTEMKDFVITNIDRIDETQNDAKVYITDSSRKQWTLSRLYITVKEKMQNNLQEEYDSIGNS